MARRDLILSHFWLKLFSLTLAVLIWLTVSFAIRKEVTTTTTPLTTTSFRTLYDVPVRIVSAAGDVHEFSANPSRIEVTVQGEAEVLEKLQTGEIGAAVDLDLADIDSADNLRKRVEVSTPAGVTYVRVKPADVEVVPPKPSIQPSTKAK